MLPWRTKTILIVCGVILLLDIAYVMRRNAKRVGVQRTSSVFHEKKFPSVTTETGQQEKHSSLPLSTVLMGPERPPIVLPEYPVDMILFMHIAKTGGTTIRVPNTSRNGMTRPWTTGPLEWIVWRSLPAKERSGGIPSLRQRMPMASFD